MTHRPSYSRSPIPAVVLVCATFGALALFSTWPNKVQWLAAIVLACGSAVLACRDGGSDGGVPG